MLLVTFVDTSCFEVMMEFGSIIAIENTRELRHTRITHLFLLDLHTSS